MIVPMQKVTVLCLEADRQSSLLALRDLGVLHVTHVQTPEGNDLDAARGRLSEARKAVALLRAARKARGKRVAPEAATVDPSDAVRRTLELASRKEALPESLGQLQRERARIEPFGDFSPAAARDLAGRGVTVRLYHAPVPDRIEVPDRVFMRVLREDRSGLYFVLVCDFEVGCKGAKEVPLPERSLEEVETAILQARQKAADVEDRLFALTSAIAAVASLAEELERQAEFLEVHAGMGCARPVCYLRGFCPADAVPQLQEAATQHGWGLLVQEPAPDDRVPVLIRNPAWIRPIEALLKFIKILPGYHETDVSASFLFFMSLFFAMIVGDAGYGLLFFLITLGARRAMRQAPPDPFRLLFIFSLCTIAWGILTGTYFGITGLTGILTPLAGLRIAWLGDNTNVMNLCLLIGAIHLTVAHVWNIIRMINSTQAIAQAGWVSVVWTMFFTARAMMFSKPFPGWFVPIAIGGLVAVIIFMTPVKKLKEEWVNHLMLPLTFMSNFGDILSYMRLFALSVAGVQLAAAFNSMAGTLGFSSPLRGLGAAVILFVGHALNIGLCALSVLVHGIRLNALEFSTHFGLEWSGFAYQPLARKVAPSAVTAGANRNA